MIFFGHRVRDAPVSTMALIVVSNSFNEIVGEPKGLAHKATVAKISSTGSEELELKRGERPTRELEFCASSFL